MLTLYQAEWCPFCHRVRQVLTEHIPRGSMNRST